MSTLKANAVTGATTNSDLTLSGNGTGGVKVNDYFVQTKGSDIASATSLTLGKDGNQFDVTGTTTITSIATQGIGSYVTLHFDGALTFTHHSTDLVLPGAANITTAAGDIAVMYEYASGDWRCVSYTKASGAAVVAAGGAWNLISTVAISGTPSTIDFEGLDDSTYTAYVMMLQSVGVASGAAGADMGIRFGTGGTPTYITNYGYGYRLVTNRSSASGYESVNAEGATSIKINDSTEDDSTKGFSGVIFFPNLTATGTLFRFMHGQATGYNESLNVISGSTIYGGQFVASAAVTAVQLMLSTSTFDSGSVSLYGIATS